MADTIIIYDESEDELAGIEAAALLAMLGLDADLPTFSLPTNTTISAFGATIVDDANAAAVLATLSLDADLATFALPANTTIATAASGFTLTANSIALAVEAASTINQDLSSDASPTFAQVNATTLHTTTILADHIGEHGSAHGIVLDNDLTRVGVIKVDHLAEATGAHGIVLDNDLTRVGTIKVDHIAEATGSHTIVIDNNIVVPAIKITTGAGANKILTSDADGDATWESHATAAHASTHAVGGADTVFPADPGADRYLKWDDDPGELVWAEVSGGAGDVGSDVIWDAKGDLAVGTGANAASRLAVGTDGKFLCAASGEVTGLKWDSPAGGSGHTIQDETTPMAARANLNFAGAGVTVTDDAGNDRTVVTIPEGGISSNDTPTNAKKAFEVLVFPQQLQLVAAWVDNPGTYEGGTAQSDVQPVLEPAETITIDTETWTFVTSRSGAYEISIDATEPFDAENQAALIAEAVNADIVAAVDAVAVGDTVTFTYTGAVGDLGMTFTGTQDSVVLSGNGTFTGGSAKQDYTFTIDDVEFKIVDSRVTAGEITLGISEDATALNIATAITADVPSVTARYPGYDNISGGYRVLIEASSAGADGNAIVVDVSNSQFTTSGGTGLLSGGVDGTAGALNEIRQSGDYLYICTTAGTAATAIWKQYSATRKAVIEVISAGAGVLAGTEESWWVVPNEYEGWLATRVDVTMPNSNTSGGRIFFRIQSANFVPPFNGTINLETDEVTTRVNDYSPMLQSYGLTLSDILTFNIQACEGEISSASGPIIFDMVIEEPFGGV